MKHCTRNCGIKKAPLVLAGVEYLFPIYQEANTYPDLVEEGITGNPENLKPEELHDLVGQWNLCFSSHKRRRWSVTRTRWS